MNYEVLYHEGFTVAGPSIKTVNNKAHQDLSLFWDKIFENDILTKIPHRTGDYVYGVYTDYTNPGNSKIGFEETGYSLTAGVQVDDTQTFPEGIVVRTIPEGKYAVFTANTPEAIVETWEEIWETEELDGQRSFVCDFEMYGEEDGKIKIFIGLK